MKNRIIPMGLLAIMTLTSTAFGQKGTGGTIKDGRVIFTQGDSPTTPTSNGPIGTFMLNGAGSPSQLFQDWWWYRVNGVDTRQNAFNSATASSWNGTTGGFDFKTPMFTAELRYTVAKLPNLGGSLTETLTITSTSDNKFNLSLFNYQDIDVSGKPFDNSAVLLKPNTIEVTNPTTEQALDYVGKFASSYMAAPSPQVRDVLTQNAIGDFNNTGLPFKVGSDFTAGWEWDHLNIYPGQTRSFQVTLQSVPEPSSWILALLSASILLFWFRRTRRPLRTDDAERSPEGLSPDTALPGLP